MKKGWNSAYLENKLNETEEKLKNTSDQSEREILEEQVDLYQLLLMSLIFQKGEVYYDNVTIEDFLSEYNGITNPYLYPKNILNISSHIAKKFISLELIHDDLTLKEKINYKDATSLIYDFLNEEFSYRDSELFYTHFIKNKSYVLLDKTNENGSVTIVGNEKFISLPNSKDIKFLCQMAHEAGHVKRIEVNKTMDINVLLGEFESFSYEIRFILWLIKNNIYRRDAIKYLLNQMIVLENNVIIRYYNNKYKLNNIKNEEHFRKILDNLNLTLRPTISNYQDIIDYIYTILSTDYLMYLFSYITVVNELDNKNFLSTYENVIRKVGNYNHDEIKISEGLKNFGDIGKYKSLRCEMLNKLREE